MALRACPYLGRVGDPGTFHLEPHHAHRCQATAPPTPIELEHQAAVCYGEYVTCPQFIPLLPDGRRAPPIVLEPPEEIVEPPAVEAPVAVAVEAGPSIRDRSVAWARRLSFEEWLVYGGAAVLLAAIVWALTFGGSKAPGRSRNPEPGVDRAAAALLATITLTPTAGPSETPRATHDAPLAATIVAPTPPAGGLMAALTPRERGVGSFNERDRLPKYGVRSMHVGRFEGRQYAGGMLFVLTRIPPNSRVTYAALEMAGMNDGDLGEGGEWTVEVLADAAADDWGNLTYPTLIEAARAELPPWRIPTGELGIGKINVLPLEGPALEYLIGQMEPGRIAFRITGPAGQDDSLFAWDTGYGEGFGTRPTLRVGFVPPPPTAGPARGEPTELPLLVPVVDPTAAPAATALPVSLPDAFHNRILFVSDRGGGAKGLFLVDPATRQMWRVTQSWPYLVARQRDTATSGAVVTDGSRPCGGATTLNESGEDVLADPLDPARQCSQILVSANGGTPIEITQPGALHYSPAISPDGQWVVYVSNVTGNDEIFKIKSDGTENTRLTENVWEWDKHPSWSTDGTQIAFWSNREGRAQIYVMNADGSGVVNVSGSGFGDSDPVWVK